ncbi:TPA: hypothetical protein ACF9FI_001770 [Streptococcus suis]
MRTIKDIFIRRPMWWQYRFSILLEIPIIFLFINNILKKSVEWEIIFYFILSLLYYKMSYRDTQDVFLSFNNQLEKGRTPTFSKYFWLSMLTCFKYICLAVLLQIAIPKFDNRILFFLILYLILSQIIFIASQMPPIIILMYIVIPLTIFSLVGIEKSLLNWTFVSLLSVSIIPQFINEDIKKMLPDTAIKPLSEILQNRNNDLKDEFLRLKYQIIIFVPFFYLALIISEKIIYTDKFNYLFNYIFDSHENIHSVAYLSQSNLMITGIKTFTVLLLLIPYIEYCNFIINGASMFIINLIGKPKNNIEYNGVFVGVRYKMFKKKWVINNSDYYFCYKRWFYHHKEKSVSLSRNDILTSRRNKRIKSITGAIFKVEGNYYINYNSSITRELSNSNRDVGYRLLNKPDHYVLLFPLILIIFVLLGSWYVESNMQDNFRGEYVKMNDNKVIQSTGLQFNDDTIFVDGVKYEIDDIKMQILDEEGNVVGKFDKKGIMIKNKKGKKLLYVKSF